MLTWNPNDSLVKEAGAAIEKCEWCENFGHSIANCGDRLMYQAAVDWVEQRQQKRLPIEGIALWFAVGAVYGVGMHWIWERLAG